MQPADTLGVPLTKSALPVPSAGKIRWLLSLVASLALQAQHKGDTAYLAQPYLVYRVGTHALPKGVEQLGAFHRGETLFVWIRFWEAAPQGQRWTWGTDTLITPVQIPPLPPDSLMPQADFTAPTFSAESPEAESVLSLTWLVGVLMGGLLALVLYPLYRGLLQRIFHQVILRARWWLWLWRWRSFSPEQFPEFCASLKDLLSPHATVHPGSLTLSELRYIHTDPKLHHALQTLWELEYRIHFTRNTTSPDEIINAWRSIWQVLRRIRPSVDRPLILLPPVHRMPDEYAVAGSSLPLHGVPSGG